MAKIPVASMVSKSGTKDEEQSMGAKPKSSSHKNGNKDNHTNSGSSIILSDIKHHLVLYPRSRRLRRKSHSRHTTESA